MSSYKIPSIEKEQIGRIYKRLPRGYNIYFFYQVIAKHPQLSLPWASYQIRKNAGCAYTGNAGNVFPATHFKEIASYRSRHASRHVRHARAVMHVGIDNPRWRGKRSRHSRRMRNPQFCVSGKRPMELDDIS